MTFNSFQFFIFLAVVFTLYRVLSHRGQNRMLLAASYVFYGAWDWRYLGLIITATVVNYACALAMERTPSGRVRRGWLTLAVTTCLGILAVFKYFNFFTDSLVTMADWIGWQLDAPTLKVLLPVGISFYTFQTMSYTIDVYRGRLAATRSLEDFALYVAFFPQLVAGPIERATNLLPQIRNPRQVSEYGLVHGGYLIGVGLLQKVFVADNLAPFVEHVFDQGGGAPGLHVLLGVYAFAAQIYCDFAGYSNMARGVALLFGFRLMANFDSPYFAVNPADFWRRWHISLSTWLRDYLYIPLGGNRTGRVRTYINLFLTMLLGGLWHGAAWTYVAWGAYHGVLLIIHRAWRNTAGRRAPQDTRGGGGWPPRIGRAASMVGVFHLVCIGWLLFRAETIESAGAMLAAVASNWSAEAWIGLGSLGGRLAVYLVPLMVLETVEFLAKDHYPILKWPFPVRVATYVAAIYALVVLGANDAQTFVYFQF